MPTTDYDISKAFKRIENELLDSMMRNLKRHKVEENKEGLTWEQWQAIQLQELEEYRKKHAKLFTGDFKSIDRKVDTAFRRTAKDAQTAEEHKLMDNIKQKKFTPTVDKGGFFRLNEGKLEALITATQADFTRAEYALLRQANDQYRKIIFDAMTYANVTNDYNKAVDMATSDFLKKGYNCVVYKNGARHDIADYARMAIRTGNKRAYLMGEGNAHDRYGLHTVRVNKRTHACPKCVGFLGKLLIDDVYGGGTRAEATAQGIPTLSDAMRAGFLHPNCKDIYSVYIDGVSRPAKPWTQEEIGEIVGEYNQEQELQHAIDMQETYQRMAKYSLDPENQQRYQARADEWQARAEEIRNTPAPPAPIPAPQPTPAPQPIPAEPPVAKPTIPTAGDVAPQATQSTTGLDVSRVAEATEELKNAEEEQKRIKALRDEYQNAKARADMAHTDVKDELKDTLSAENYQFVLDHLEAFENDTIQSDVDNRIKALQEELAKAREKAFDVLRSDVGFTVDAEEFKDMPTLLVVENTEQLATLEKKFGAVGKSIDPSMHYHKGGGNTNASVTRHIVQPDHQYLNLYESHYGDVDTLRTSRARCKANGWSMPCKEEEFDIYTVTHEYGHMIHNILMSQDLDAFHEFKTRATTYKGRVGAYKKLQEKQLGTYRQEIIDIAMQIDSDFDITKELSRYGQTANAEFFAEAFANSQLGEPNTLGKAMLQWLKGRGYA